MAHLLQLLAVVAVALCPPLLATLVVPVVAVVLELHRYETLADQPLQAKDSLAVKVACLRGLGVAVEVVVVPEQSVKMVKTAPSSKTPGTAVTAE